MRTAPGHDRALSTLFPRHPEVAEGPEPMPPVASAPVLSAMLVVGGPALFALSLSNGVSSPALAGACAVLVSLAGALLARGSRWSLLLAFAGLSLGLWGTRRVLVESPDFALMFVVACGVILNAVWGASPEPGRRSSWVTTFATVGAAKSGAASAVALWVALAINESTYSRGALTGAGACFGLASALLVGSALRLLLNGSRSALLPLGGWAVGVAVALGLWTRPTWALSAWLGGIGAAALFLRADDDDPAPAWAPLLEHPARLVVASFAALCALGMLILALPVSARSGHGIGLLDAMFTAVSAGCVTGLVVLDTAGAFSGLGQAVLLGLIQVGGLGIMTFYTVALRAMGLRLGLRHEVAVTEASLLDDQSSLYRALGSVLGLTVLTEASGAAMLFVLFRHEGRGWAEALWEATFTAISAFCNAGFALAPDSLIPHQRQPLVLGVVAALIVLGGLAPAVVIATPAWLRGRVVSLQVRLVWLTTLGLLAFGFLGFLAFEWSNTLLPLPWWHKLTNAAFQSVTLRTAGFNSVDIAATTAATQQIMMALMFIGGSPGGTAGGIKTTTVALLILAVAAALRGQGEVTLFERRIVPATVYRAAAVATLGVLSVVALGLGLMLTQPLAPQVALFESVSALGTVGLSTGGTALLDGIGKVLVALGMFIGRVGPLTLFLLLGERRARANWRFPDAEVDVG